jgi:hypothetical protein
MLTGDAGLPAGPPFAQVVKIGHDHLTQDGLHGEIGQQPVRERLRCWLVEGIQAAGQHRNCAGQALAAARRRVRGVLSAERGAGGLGGGQARPR